ncbi:PREDICTED: integrator complex subunit 9 [Fragaria vesca subsp. vesca]|uniref:integrator complex subunit 9 n=1 Tax=Fragaria vesca subsp. vesca TaxID=101020 RepID=UPI0002C33F1C|nr:PREDICTED: integrator complex subunit 9 [Fragaria vesca subsp. vesca]
MKFTCLSKGGGYHFPPCHILDICGFRILLDCPLDLSALTIFSPIPSASKASSIDKENPKCLNCSGPSDREESLVRKRQKVERPLDADDLIYAEPWYKTVRNMHLWNTSFIDVVLISSPMGMLGLPFLTRTNGFSAKIYVTEATARLGQLMMDDLVSMHMEIRQLLGPEESSFPSWMKWEELKLLPSSLRDVALGKDGGELGSWMPLYSAADVKGCVQKAQRLKYAEETCYNSTLIIKAFSSGLEIGTCNWTINGPKGGIAFISSSIFDSAHAMNFDYLALRGNDTVIYSDFSSLDGTEDIESDHNNLVPTTHDFSSRKNEENDGQDWAESVLHVDDNLEEMQKLTFLSSHVIDSVKAGGSVLIPVSRLGIVLQLLEQISASLDVSGLKVPIYVVSSVGEELLAFTNIIPEWLCKPQQEKMFSGQPLFGHVELINEGKLHVFPAIHSPKLLMNWQEPCIVFSPHWSLRLGPSVHFLQRWCGDQNSLLILENELDVELALLPFKPMAMKVLRCSFLSGIRLLKVQPLLNVLQPKVLLFPKDLKLINSSKSTAFSIFQYCPDETLCIPSLKDKTELEIATDLACHFDWRKLKQGDISIARLKGELFRERGKQRLISGKVQESLEIRPLVHWGLPDLDRLLTVLSSRGIKGTVRKASSGYESENSTAILVTDPSEALIEVKETSTVITATSENLASVIFEAIGSILDGI